MPRDPNQSDLLDRIGGLTITELAILDGATLTTAELNLLDGVSGLVQADFTKLAAVDSTAAELNLLNAVSGLVKADLTKLAAVNATAPELNILDNQVASVTIGVGSDQGTTVAVTLQFKDAAGADMATPVCVSWYYSTDSAGLDPMGTAHDGGTAIGSDGALIEHIADLSGLMISEADGDVDLVVTDAGAFTAYLVVVLPTGALAISAVITHDA